jgi:hypothetical protein
VEAFRNDTAFKFVFDLHGVRPRDVNVRNDFDVVGSI